MISKWFCAIYALLWVGCVSSNPILKQEKSGVVYADNFSYQIEPDYIWVKIYNPWNVSSVLQSLVLVPKTSALPDSLPQGLIIRTPVERAVVCSTVHCAMFEMLRERQIIVGVCDGKYVNLPFIRQGIIENSVVDLGNEMMPNVERLVALRPELILASFVDDVPNEHLERTGIPVIKCLDYMETTPLGRAEWLKLAALLTERAPMADSLFATIDSAYQSVCGRVKAAVSRPTVFSDTKMGNVWYQPGGRSYMAHLFADAGADYLWASDSSSGSLPLSFEKVFERAEKADFWFIKNYGNQAYDRMRADFSPYAQFAAFRNRRVFYCDTAEKPYYERTPLHPDELLRDMALIFHPDLFPTDTLKYYTPMR